MILLAAYAGLRVSEIAAIKGDDVDTVINTITVIGKGDKERQFRWHPVSERSGGHHASPRVVVPHHTSAIPNTWPAGPSSAIPSAPASPTS